MRFLITKVWNWQDIWLLKWCCLLFGVVAGVYFHDFIFPYRWYVFAGALLLAIRPAVAYWKK